MFLSITEEQQAIINKCCREVNNSLKEKINNQLNMELDDQHVFKILICYFLNQPLRDYDELFSTFASFFQGKYLNNVKLNTAMAIANSENMIGKMLSNTKYVYDIVNTDEYQNTFKIICQTTYSEVQQQAIQNFIETLFSKGYKFQYQESILYNYDFSNLVKINKYLKSYVGLSVFEKTYCTDSINLNGYVNVYAVNQYYNDIKQLNTNSLKANLFKKIYEIIQQQGIENKYNIYRVLYYIYKLSNEQLCKYLNLTSSDDIQMIIQMIQNQVISYEYTLQCYGQIYKFVEQITMKLSISEQYFECEENSQLFANLFTNIQNRMQLITNQRYDFCIIHCVKDGQTFCRILDPVNYHANVKFLKQFNNNQVYDVIIQGWTYQGIQNIKMRSLNYNGTQRIKLKLKYPEELISASIVNVQINNLNQCKNLKNLYAKCVTFSSKDIGMLRKLQRVHLYDNCFLNDTNTPNAKFWFGAPTFGNPFTFQNQQQQQQQQQQQPNNNIVQNILFNNPLQYFLIYSIQQQSFDFSRSMHCMRFIYVSFLNQQQSQQYKQGFGTNQNQTTNLIVSETFPPRLQVLFFSQNLRRSVQNYFKNLFHGDIPLLQSQLLE